MPIAIWPPGNPVRFSYWKKDEKRNERHKRRKLGVVVDASYRNGGYVEIQSLHDLATHRFDFDASGDYACGVFPRDGAHGEPVEVQAPDVIDFVDRWPADRPRPSRKDAHPKTLEYLKRIGREEYLS